MFQKIIRALYFIGILENVCYNYTCIKTVNSVKGGEHLGRKKETGL